MNKQKGFTIIELIVVIAIIAILAAIVLVNVTQYINKGRDAAIKGNMATLLTNAAVYFDDNPSNYGDDYIASSDFATVETTVESNNIGGTITSAGSATTQDWCASSPEKVDSTIKYCVDNTGAKKESATAVCSATTFVCAD